MLSWKCLSDIQGEMLSKQLGTQVWNSGEKLGKAVKIKSHRRIRWFQSRKTEWGHQGNEYREKVRGVRTGTLWNKRSGERRDQPGWTWRTGQRWGGKEENPEEAKWGRCLLEEVLVPCCWWVKGKAWDLRLSIWRDSWPWPQQRGRRWSNAWPEKGGGEIRKGVIGHCEYRQRQREDWEGFTAKGEVGSREVFDFFVCVSALILEKKIAGPYADRSEWVSNPVRIWGQASVLCHMGEVWVGW